MNVGRACEIPRDSGYLNACAVCGAPADSNYFDVANFKQAPANVGQEVELARHALHSQYCGALLYFAQYVVTHVDEDPSRATALDADPRGAIVAPTRAIRLYRIVQRTLGR